MVRSVLQGAAQGAIFGATLAMASAGFAAFSLGLGLRMAQSGLTPTTLGLAAWTVALAAALGAALGPLTRRPIAALTLLFGALALGDPTYPLAQLGAVLLAGGLGAAAVGRRGRTLALLAALALALLALRPRALPGEVPPVEARAPHGAPSVLWVVFDTARADRINAETTPNLMKLADEGVRFTRAYAPAPWTLPSHASMFTGLYPNRHGARDGHQRLGAGPETVAERFRAAGYRTLLISSNPWVSAETGLGRGFTRIIPTWERSLGAPFFPAARLLKPWQDADKGAMASVRAFAEQLSAGGPFFAVVNLLEAHTPYHEVHPDDRALFVAGPDLAAAERASAAYNRFVLGQGAPPTAVGPLHALYDAGLHADDRALGELLALLDSRGLRDNTLVLVTSDHGESFGEAGRWQHHAQPGEEVLRVPLVLGWPGRLGRGELSPAVSLVDLFPTVLQAVGLPIPPGLDGRPLWEAARGQALEPRPLYAEGDRPANAVQARRFEALGLDPATYRWSLAQLDDLRLVREAEAERLCRVSADPEAALSGEPEARAALTALLDAYSGAAGRPGAAPGPLSEAAQERLRALGYLE